MCLLLCAATLSAGYLAGAREGTAGGGTSATGPRGPLASVHAPVNGIRMYYEIHGRRDGARQELWELIERGSFSEMPQALKDAFLKVNPDPQKLRTMHDKDLARMRSFKDVPDDVVRSLRASTLILAGDRDVVTPEHAVELTRLIPDARLLIVPGGHGDYLGEVTMAESETRYPELMAALIERFLAMPSETR